MSPKLKSSLAQPIEKYKFISEIAGTWGLISSLLAAREALPFLSVDGSDLT